MRCRSSLFCFVAVCGLGMLVVSCGYGQQLPPIINAASKQVQPTRIQNPYLIPEYYQQDEQAGNQDKKQDVDQVPIAPGSGQQRRFGPGLEVQSNAENILEPGSWCRIGCNPDRLFGCTQNGFCIGGWAQAGYHTRSNGLFNSFPDRVRAQQIWFHVEQLTDPCQGRNWGFRLDAAYGTDAQLIQAFGNSPPAAPDNWDNEFDYGIYGWALPQAYIEYSNGPLTAKAGYFFAPVGAEPIAAVDNFFYSHTFIKFNTRPYSVTGALLEFDNGSATWVTGVTAGWNSAFENIGDAVSYMGGFRTCLANGAKVSSMFTVGETGIFGSGYGNSSTFDTQITKKLSYGLYSDYYKTDAFEDISITNQFVIRTNRCLGLGTRLEYYRTDRLGGGDRSSWGWTSGINYRPHQNFVLRPEVRLDWGPSSTNSGQAYYGVDAIMMF